MNPFYENRENLVDALTHYLSIFSEGNTPIVPKIRTANGSINVRATFDLIPYRDFPQSEKDIWLEHQKDEPPQPAAENEGEEK